MSDSNKKTPEIAPSKGSWMVWIVPVIALIIGAYLVYQEFATRGPLITITFEDGTGLEAKRTKLVSKGVIVGSVESIHLSKNLKNVVVKARLDKAMSLLAREDTRMWIVRPEISVSGVQGLDTILSGPCIEVDPGGGAEKRVFEGLLQHPRYTQESHHYTLHTNRKLTAHPGAPVKFRNMQVGIVDSVELSTDSTEVIVKITIEEPYFRLIRKGTKFWDSGGVDMKVNLLGAQIRTGSLESILSGSIEFATPPDTADSAIAQSGSHFVLHNEVDEKWLEWKAAIELRVKDDKPEPQTLGETSKSDTSLLESDG